MFKNPFSFDGRIRRTEYGLSFIIFAVARTIIMMIAAGTMSSSSDTSGAGMITFIFSLPLFFFLLAQGAKRCHDVEMSGWFQLIPLFPLYLLFAEGKKGSNKYGDDPKQTNSERQNF